MSQLTISLPTALQDWIDARLAEGAYSDAADYLRDLVRQDIAATSADRRWLKAMVDEGFASGVLDREPEDILDEVIAEDPDLRA
jgi:antitoxin ParD1/3/4